MSVPLTVYDHIKQNNLKTFGLLCLFPVSLIVLSWVACLAAIYINQDYEFTAMGLQLFIPLQEIRLMDFESPLTNMISAAGFASYIAVPAVVLCSVWMFISYLFGDKIMLGFAEAKPMSEQSDPKVFRAVENVAIMAGLPTPKTYIIEDASLNAFATGRSPKHASIAFTRGIIDKLEPIELEGVIAHEMAHIGNRDVRLNMLMIAGLSVFAMLADIFRIFLNSKSSNRSNGKNKDQAKVLVLCLFIAFLILNFFVAPLIRLAISRTREYAADATAALIIRNPRALASALRKISKDSRVEVVDNKPSIANVFIADPKTNFTSDDNWSSTHPSINSRIQRLENM